MLKLMIALSLAGSLAFGGAATARAGDPAGGQETAACFVSEPCRIAFLILIGIGGPN